MNVRLAAQILSKSVADALYKYGSVDSHGTANFCEMLDTFFDCVNVRAPTVKSIGRKANLDEYVSVEDERLKWLTGAFFN